MTTLSLLRNASTVCIAYIGAFAAIAQTPPTDAEVSAFSALHRAAHLGDVATIEAAAKSGADVNALDSKSRTPAHVAAFASQDAALAALAKAGADLNALEYQIYDVVTIAAVANDRAIVALAIELGNRPDLTTSIYDGTALIAAAHLGHHEVVRILIDAGAPLDHVNNLEWTALIEAVILGDGGPDHIATVDHLVNAGADLSIGDRYGVTPLQHARKLGYAEIVALLETADN
ncbi:MAG: ankyrin repeat domain-containing protein [Boseongicola sp.]